MPSKEPPRRRVPGPARARTPRRPGRLRPAAGRPGPPARRRPAPAAARRHRPRTIRLGSPRPRLRLVSLALTLVMLAFVVRLLQVQAVDASAYAAKADKNRYVSHTLAAERGEITDRNGVALATSVDAYDITADPTMFTPRGQQGRRTPPSRPPRCSPRSSARTRRELAEEAHHPQHAATRCSPAGRPRRSGTRSRTSRPCFAEKAGRTANGGTGANVLAGVFQRAQHQARLPQRRPRRRDTGLRQRRGQGRRRPGVQLDKELAGKDGKIRYAQSGGRRVPTAGSTREARRARLRRRADHRPRHPVGGAAAPSPSR